jgi:uncharacterized protein (TIGR02147 family)
MPKRLQLPDIYRYKSYAKWLGDAFEAVQGQDASMTHRKFSELCGYKSSGAISLISSGRRRLSVEGARRIAGALRLNAGKSQHLEYMVQFEQADDFEARAGWLRKMRAAKHFAETWEDTLKAYDVYAHWYLPVLLEVVSLPDFQEDPAWVVARIHQKITPQQVREGLAQLQRLGFLGRDDQGLLRRAEMIISTPAEVSSDVLKQHQREMMKLAADALDTQERERRDMRVSTVAISRNQAARIKARLTQLQKELAQIVAEDEPIEGVYQLNTQLFELTDPPEEDGS